MDQKISSLLITTNCLQLRPLEPFTYASGLKGPIYCDNRKLLSHIDARNEVVESFRQLIKENNVEYDTVAGLATAGIPHGTLLADRERKPFIYIRSSAKKHGKQNQIEGHYQKGDRVILVEDLINQGSSLEKAILAAQSEGLVIEAVFSIVTYEMPAAFDVIERHKLKSYSLVTFSNIVDYAYSTKSINEKEKELLAAWQQDPSSWSNNA